MYVGAARHRPLVRRRGTVWELTTARHVLDIASRRRGGIASRLPRSESRVSRSPIPEMSQQPHERSKKIGILFKNIFDWALNLLCLGSKPDRALWLDLCPSLPCLLPIRLQPHHHQAITDTPNACRCRATRRRAMTCCRGSRWLLTDFCLSAGSSLAYASHHGPSLLPLPTPIIPPRDWIVAFLCLSGLNLRAFPTLLRSLSAATSRRQLR
jgi:hypothetical protein